MFELSLFAFIFLPLSSLSPTILSFFSSDKMDRRDRLREIKGIALLLLSPFSHRLFTSFFFFLSLSLPSSIRTLPCVFRRYSCQRHQLVCTSSTMAGPVDGEFTPHSQDLTHSYYTPTIHTSPPLIHFLLFIYSFPSISLSLA